jgi:hypothetical protein
MKFTFYAIIVSLLVPFIYAEDFDRGSIDYANKVTMATSGSMEDRNWLRQEFAICSKSELLPSKAVMALSSAAIKLASEQDSLEAYNYLSSRLLNSKNNDEKRDAISKLSIWPGMQKFSHTTLILLLYVKSVDGHNKAIESTLDRSIEQVSVWVKTNTQ